MGESAVRGVLKRIAGNHRSRQTGEIPHIGESTIGGQEKERLCMNRVLHVG